MPRRGALVLALAPLLTTGCLAPEPAAGTEQVMNQGSQQDRAQPVRPEEGLAEESKPGRIEMTDAQWRERLSPEEYHITREKGTEPAFSGRYVHTKTEGTYRCVCCGSPLFSSEHKFDSGSGWPSFWTVAEEGHVGEHPDHSLGMERTEITCDRCGAHLGHVFPDGPRPTGLRYCVNSASLRLEEATPQDGEQKATGAE